MSLMLMKSEMLTYLMIWLQMRLNMVLQINLSHYQLLT